MTFPKCDNDCTLMGWKEYILYADCYDLHVSVAPETDLDSIFMAFCHDEQEMINVTGWQFTAEEQ